MKTPMLSLRSKRLGFALAVACLSSFGAGAAGCNGALGSDDDAHKGGGCPDDLAFFEKNVWEPILSAKCALCHSPQGLAKSSRMVFEPASSPDAVEKNFEKVRAMAALLVNKDSALLLRPSGRHPDGHGGGTVLAFDGPEYRTLATFVRRVNQGTDCDVAPTSCEVGAVSGHRLLRRLSRVEYDRTVRELLGVDPSSYEFAADARVNGFDNNADRLRVSTLLVEQLRTAAEDMAEKALQNPGSLLPCAVASGDATCAGSFIDAFGKKAFRRPVTETERARYTTLYAAVAADDGFAGGVQAIIAAMLQSPNFLYRTELGAGAVTSAGDFELTSYEIASALSYLIWGSMPDEALFQKAEAGGLSSPETIAAEADRLLADPKAAANVEQFAEQWLDIKQLAYKAKDAAVYPEFDEGVKEGMFHETRAFFRHVMTEGSGTLSELLTAKYSMMDDELAAFYGLPAPGGTADADGFKQVDVSGANRGGLLTLGAVLSTHARPSESSPIHRGKFVRERLLCQPMALPPPGLEIVPPGLDPSKSTRERFTAHSADPLCKSCHTLMDPIGFGFEHFDGVGRYRASEGNVTIDVNGEIAGSKNTSGPFDGIDGLAAKLASSPDVEACFALQWLRFGFGVEDQAELSCTAGQLTKELSGEKLTIPALIKAITRSPRFTRRLAEGTTAPSEPGGGSGGAGGGGGTTSSNASSSSASSSSGGPTPTNDISVREDVYTTWATGGCERAYVTNNGSSTVAWEVTLMPPAPVSSFYGTQTPQPVGAGVKFVGADYNAMVAPGATVEFGFCWGN